MKSRFALLTTLLLRLAVGAYGQDVAKPMHTLDTEGELRSIAFSPDGKLVASISGTKTAIQLWEAETGRPVSTLTTGKDPANFVGKSNYLLVMPRVGYTQLDFSPDGRLLAVVSQVTQDVRLWDIRAGKLYTTLTGVKDISSVEFSPDGKLLALGMGVLGLRLLDVYSGQLLTTKWDFKRVDSVTGAAFSGDGKTLVVGIDFAKESESGFYFMEVATGKRLGAVVAPAARQLYGRISPDRRNFATFENNSGDIRVWDLATGQPKKTIATGKAKMRELAFSPDGRTVAVLRKDGGVQLWDAETAGLKAELQQPDSKTSYVAFLPAGNTLLSMDAKGLKIWDASTGALAQSLDDARGPADFSRDGRLLAAANKKGAPQVWQLLK